LIWRRSSIVRAGAYPQRTASLVGLPFVGEGDCIPASTSTFELLTVGPSKTLASIIPWSKELSKRADAESVFRTLLAEDLAQNLDAAILSTNAGSASVPAGLLAGVAALGAFPGGDRTAIETDLASLGAAVSDGGSGGVVYITTPKLLSRLRILAPEIAGSIDVVPSAALPAGRLIAVDARAILIELGAPEFLSGDHALIHLSTVPLPISDGGVADPVRSD
jgi:hypothetical protein